MNILRCVNSYPKNGENSSPECSDFLAGREIPTHRRLGIKNINSLHKCKVTKSKYYNHQDRTVLLLKLNQCVYIILF